MFFVTYVRSELRRRMRQAISIALGLALGVGLVVTVAAASAGVTQAQSQVLSTLYGAATTVTVTGPKWQGSAMPQGTPFPVVGPHGMEICLAPPPAARPRLSHSHRFATLKPGQAPGDKCTPAAGKTLSANDILTEGISGAKVAAAARLPGVAAAAGGIFLNESWESWPKNDVCTGLSGGLPVPRGGRPGGHPHAPGGRPPAAPCGGRGGGYPLEGVDTGHPRLGPLGAASLLSGRLFTAADATAHVAVVDAEFAASHHLRVGAQWSIVGPADANGHTPAIKFTVIGIVGQAAGINPPSVYVPLKAAQDLMWLQSGPASLQPGKVTSIYLAAASAADVPKVTAEITRLLPGSTVDSASAMATAVAGSVKSAAKLAHDLGRWLAVLVLIAAFAVASLLTIAAVVRRSAEFGTLKALGWRTRRIIAQVLGESLAVGLAGAAAGIALGYTGAAIIAAVIPSVSATVGENQMLGGDTYLIGGSPVQTDVVPLHPTVSATLLALAVILAVAGALLAGAFACWRIARLRPANALSQVA
jgi:putative ABC transport system permease protein